MNLTQYISNWIENFSGTAALCIKNLSTGKTFSYNEDVIFPSASIIKLLIMCEILRKVKIGRLKLDDKITINDDKKTHGDGFLKYLEPGHSFSVKELVTIMIILSDNTAANILIDMAGINDINAFSAELGLKNTILKRKMMDFDAARKGKENLTCAKDICTYFDLLYQGKIIDSFYSKLMIDILKKQHIDGRINLYLPQNITLAHKTGTLCNLEHDAGILYTAESDYIMCIFTKEGESNGKCREFIGNIAKSFYDEYINNSFRN